jgi:hypothetical protein
MTPFMSLLVPIVLSALAVFILSSIIHMAMPWHKNDYPGLPDEDGVMKVLRPFNIPPGDYMVPRPRSRADMKSPEFLEKHALGPVIIMTVIPNGPWNMGKLMGTWFLYCLLISAISGFMASHVAGPGANDHRIFHFVGFTAFLCYTMGAWPLSIWYHRKWLTTIKGAFDALIYGVVTGLIFVFLWPTM